MFGTKETFNTYIIPISGIDFVRYIAFYSLLAEYQIKPKVIYCASGGCLASYMALMSGFTKNIESWKISSDMFIDKITPFNLRMITFALRGYFYRRANITEYIERLFIPAKLQNVEIISGYFSLESNKNIINSNMPKEKSVLNNLDINSVSCSDTLIYFLDALDETNYEKLIRETICRIIHTTNIPIFLEPQGNVKAIDFGIIGLSPRTIVNANMDKSIYFCPINIEKKTFDGKYDIIFHKIIMQDIIQVRSMFKNEINFNTFPMVIDFIKKRNRYCLLMYSGVSVNLPIESFTSEGVFECMRSCKKSVKLKIFFD